MADDGSRNESEDELRRRARELFRNGLTASWGDGLRDAVNFFEESLALYRSLSGAERQRAVCPFNIGALSVRLGYYREAAVSYDESADLFHRIPGGQRDASDLRTPLTPQTGWVRVGDVLAHRLQRAALRQDPAAVGRRIVVLGRGVPRAGPASTPVTARDRIVGRSRCPPRRWRGLVTSRRTLTRGRRDRAVVVDDMAARFPDG